MNFGWFAAWWHQLTKQPVSDPWNDDPEIQRERDRQHREGITDAATAYRARQQLRQRRIRTTTETWRRDVHH